VPTFAQLLRDRRGDEHLGLIFEDQTFTWADIVRESEQRAGLVEQLGGAGTHVGVLLDNVPDYQFWIGGAALSGATVVGINPTRRGEQLAHDIRHTDVQVIVTDRAHLPLLAAAGVELPLVLVEDADHAGLAGPVRADHEQSTLLLLFTSGSTGAPKAVICTNGRLGRLAAVSVELFGVVRDQVTYQAMPMFHGNALMTNIAPATASGATIVLRRRFSASSFSADVRRHGATFFNYVGRSLAYVLATPETSLDRDNRLRLGFGTEASARDIEKFSARFDCEIMENYGSSEGVISIRKQPGCPPGALGLPAPGQDVAVLGPDGRECPPARTDRHGRLVNADAAIGEIVNRTGAVAFEGYYRNAEAEQARIDGDAYRTGDLGYRDAAGWFWFAGRDTDWLRVDSENFAAAPVETILGRWAPVVLAAVYAVPDARTGDQVMAALELSAEFDPRAFADFLDAQPDLGTKWAPRFVRIVDKMPVTGTNKVAKLPLRRERWETADVWVRDGVQRSYRPLMDADRAALRAAFDEHGRTRLLV
jgi:fatty-acyl-CoA synthase